MNENTGSIAITGEANTRLFGARACLSALGLEIRTGMVHSGRRSTMTMANGWLAEMGKPRKGTKLNVYKALRAALIEAGMPVNDTTMTAYL